MIINKVLLGPLLSLASVFGTAPYCTDNGASLSCYYYSPQACTRAAEQLGLMCVWNPKRDIPGYTEPSYRQRRGRK
jgi:hypothetical protein